MRTTLCIVLLLAACRSTTPDPTLASARDDGFRVVSLRFASAPELAGELNELLAAGQTAGPFAKPIPKLIADPRTNSLLVRAEPDDLSRVLELVEKLDQQVGQTVALTSIPACTSRAGPARRPGFGAKDRGARDAGHRIRNSRPAPRPEPASTEPRPRPAPM
jgi:hypothetical protein